jgi:tetratricopeptide (TPR) repeat protein
MSQKTPKFLIVILVAAPICLGSFCFDTALAGEDKPKESLGSELQKLLPGTFKRPLSNDEIRASLDPKAAAVMLRLRPGMELYAAGQRLEAIQAWEVVLAECRKEKNQWGESFLLSMLAELYTDSGNSNKAAEYAQQGLSIAQTIKNPILESFANVKLMQSDLLLGQYEQAMAKSERLLEVAKSIDAANAPPSGLLDQIFWAYFKNTFEGNALLGLSISHTFIGDYEQGSYYAERSLSNARQVKDPILEGLSLLTFGSIHAQTGDYKRAIDYSQRGLDTVKGDKGSIYEMIAYTNMAIAYGFSGDYDKAMK